MGDDPVERARRAARGSPYLNTDQAAHYLHVSRRKLQKLRERSEGPAYRRHSRTILYHIDDLDAWSTAQTDGATR